MRKPKNNFNFAYLLWFGGLLVLITFLHSQHLFDADEGVVLAGAWRMINGQKIYTDFFAMTTPLSYYLIFWIWQIFTVNYISAWIFGILLLFGSTIGTYKISYLITKDKLSLFVPYLFAISTISWPVVNYHNFSLFFIIWAVYFFLIALQESGNKNLLISGLLTAATFLTLQHKGLALMCAGASYLLFVFIKNPHQRNLKKLSLYLLTSFTPLLWLILSWPSKLIFDDLLTWPFLHYSNIARVGLNGFYLFLTLLVVCVIILKKYWSKELLFIFYLYFALLFTSIPAANYFHIIIISFPLFTLLPLIIKTIKKIKNGRTFVFIELTLVVLIVLLNSLMMLMLLSPFYSDLKNNKLINYINDKCNATQNIYAGPFAPEIYFYAKKQNFSHFNWLITNHNTEQQFVQATIELKNNPPACAVLNYNRVKKYRYSEDNPVDKFIKQNYFPAFKKNNYEVWQKTKPLP